MAEYWELRPAQPAEADDLTALVLRSLAHWGHDVNVPDLLERVAVEDAVTPEYVRENEAWVLEGADGVAGFHGLKPVDDDLDLTYMFLEPLLIGRGLGSRMWAHALERARATDGPRLRIVSDPEAIGFYAAMGAHLERRVEVAPGFALGLMWFEL